MKKRNFADIIIIFLLTIWALAIIYPFYNAVLVSVVPQSYYIRTPFMLFPKEFSINSYRYVFSDKILMNGMFVTSIVTIVGVLYNMILTTFLAYALTKHIPGVKFVSYLIIFSMYFTGGLIPFYLLMTKLGLIDSVFSMILPTGINFMYLIVIKGNFVSLPNELEESAKLDGANELIILMKILIPLSLPILATFGLYYGVERWNEWWYGMLFIKDVKKLPMQLVLRSIIQDASNTVSDPSGKYSEDTIFFSEGVKMAAIVVTMFPIMCLYPFLQRYFISGLTIGAVKL